ncbi:mitochondrial import receptor subunit TOM70 isoform X2 [Toxorhynchites rutilus septentrionalis]|uniref:mitochondrial import receptor subunit TOM70 isoform X1 n=1 Tax=Toxorhynchites rutilus septentrionalis TaxID=329112 RepID=UPI0024795DC8|nr:mitochondrial import receptor subunit TOM70 isoform X1 [Toxorhynchites rutilus septentrionalis]XP_055636642.1 mitochondrial import receptor subunit TOM70 isoform X2 [Toxorhynchites rutilus septentrionalis]
MSTGSTGSTFPKWQLAILIGAPVALGIGYLYWKKSTQPEGSDDKLKKKKLGELKDKTISLDEDERSRSQDVPAKKKTPTPLEEAQKFKNNGNAYFRDGKYEQAIEEYNRAIEKCPDANATDLSTFYQNRAAAFEHLQKWSEVIQDCSKALACNPKYLKALKRRAKAYEHQQDLAKSFEDTTAACILEGFQNNSTLMMADRVLKELGLQHAKEALKQQRPDIRPSKFFMKTFFASFMEDPIKKMVVASTDPKGFVKAKLLLDQGECDEIVAACTDEIESSEAEAEYKVEAMLLRATMYLLTAHFDEATADLDTIISMELADKKLRANALIKRASLAMQVQPNTPEVCFVYFTQAEEVDPHNSDIYHHRGQVYILAERFEEAIKDFQKASSLYPNSGIIEIHKCYAIYRQAMQNKDEYALREVIEGFRNAIERFPDCVECYSLMAQVLSDQQEFQEADNFFDKASKIEPENAQILVHKALLQLQWTAEVNPAMRLIEKAIQIDDKCGYAYETLGAIQVQRGELQDAIRLFDSAIKLAKTEMELVHLFSLKDAAIAQMNVTQNMGLDIRTIAEQQSKAIW